MDDGWGYLAAKAGPVLVDAIVWYVRADKNA